MPSRQFLVAPPQDYSKDHVAVLPRFQWHNAGCGDAGTLTGFTGENDSPKLLRGPLMFWLTYAG